MDAIPRDWVYLTDLLGDETFQDLTVYGAMNIT